MRPPAPAPVALHLRLLRDPLAALSAAAEVGEVVAFRTPRGPLVSLGHPDAVARWHALLADPDPIDPAPSVSAIGRWMVEIGQERLRRVPLGSRELLADLTLVARDVVFATVLGEPRGVEARALAGGVRVATARLDKGGPFRPPDPRSIRAALVRLLDRALASRSPGDEDLAGQLVRAGTLAPHQVHDALIELMLAGQVLAPLALGWAAHLLGANPGIQAQIRGEVARHGVPTSIAALEHRPWLVATVDEAMRLYPPVVSPTRAVEEPLELLGVTVPAGARIVASPWVVQRDARWWADPLRFRPDRWFGAHPPAGAHVPLADDGSTLAATLVRLEVAVLLALLLERAELSADPAPPRLSASVLLRPADGFRVRLSPAPKLSFRQPA
jgi:cytochrome P450